MGLSVEDAARFSGRVRGFSPSVRKEAGRCGEQSPGAAGPSRPWWRSPALALVGAGSPQEEAAEPPPPKVEETVGDLAYIVSSGEIKLEGVGLVVGLDNTGVDPPPSWYREKLVDEMRKAGVENPNEMLEDPRCSMVIVRLTIPTGVTPDRPARRRGRAAPGQRHDEPGRRLPAADPAPPRCMIAGGDAQGGPRAAPSPRGRS